MTIITKDGKAATAPFVIKNPALMSEKQIEDKVVEWAVKQGFLAPKVKFHEKGWPDRMFVSPYGATIFIEFKRLGGVPDDLQAHRLRELQRRGIPVACCDSVFSALRVLQAALEPPSLPETSDPVAIITRGGRPVPGSRFRQDVDSLGNTEDLKDAKTLPAGVDSRAAQGSAGHMAGREREMGGFLIVDDVGPAWPKEGYPPKGKD